jgi:hypothetical protein
MRAYKCSRRPQWFSPSSDDLLNSGSASANQLEYQRHYRQYQQDVDESAKRVAGNYAQQPQHQQNYKQGPKHFVTSEIRYPV